MDEWREVESVWGDLKWTFAGLSSLTLFSYLTFDLVPERLLTLLKAWRSVSCRCSPPSEDDPDVHLCLTRLSPWTEGVTVPLLLWWEMNGALGKTSAVRLVSVSWVFNPSPNICSVISQQQQPGRSSPAWLGPCLSLTAAASPTWQRPSKCLKTLLPPLRLSWKLLKHLGGKFTSLAFIPAALNLSEQVWIVPLSQILEWPTLSRLRCLHQTSLHHTLLHVLEGITGSQWEAAAVCGETELHRLP